MPERSPEEGVPAPVSDPLRRLGDLRADQERRWGRGERVQVEDYLRHQPDLGGDGELLVDLICHEFLLAEARGESPRWDEYCRRFPRFAPELRLQEGLHHALEASGGEVTAGLAAPPEAPAASRPAGTALKGKPLDARLRREGRLALAELLRVGRETAERLAAVHAKGLVHRNVKPANLWLEGDDGRVRLLEFGQARPAGRGTGSARGRALVGAPAYVAPEQAGGQTIDSRADLFSLGCVLYEAATGQKAFRGADIYSTMMAVARDRPRPPHEVDPELPPALSDLVMRLLAKRPADRPPSADAVAEALRRLERGEGYPGDARPPVAGNRLSSRRLVLVGAGAAVVAGVLLLATLLLRGGRSAPDRPGGGSSTSR